MEVMPDPYQPREQLAVSFSVAAAAVSTSSAVAARRAAERHEHHPPVCSLGQTVCDNTDGHKDVLSF
uniref:Uncharacterized protein n=1 Tax=Oryza sativa subsp. japonica TaxID=39947 RepID=Q6K4G5_ORYSJ|nr:hypothetical protein [Oryza sativa Japonica Group]BAD25991.1 hypothetical protein [Oryza sativa Japonica Group]